MKSRSNDDRQIGKLEKQIADFEKELTIETKEQDVIKDYKMKEGDYQILVTVYQANELMPRGNDFFVFKSDKTACDAFVEIEIRDQIRRTSIKKDTNNPIFDQKFYFKFQGLTIEDLDRSAISFKVYDKKQFILRDSLLGSFEVDWTNVYFKRNHEIYRGWLTLMDPFDEEEGVMGYLLVSIAVLGESDKVTVHDSAFIKDPLTTIEDTITMPKLQLIDYGINIQVYRAENLVPLDEFAGNVDAYVIAKFSGNKMDTSVKASCNPQWDQLIRIGTAVPTKSKYVLLEVRNRNYITGDDLIGVIKIPFVDLKQQSQARWGHLYGPPVSGKDEEPYNLATKMQVYGQYIGSHYRGRLLFKITGHKDIINKNSRSKINFKFPYKPTPVVPLKSYTLRIEILDGFNLPGINNKSECYIHCCIGHYMVVSRSFGELRNNFFTFLEKLPDKKVQLPEDQTQIPDLIIYLAKGEREKDRISYVRVPASSIMSTPLNANPMTIYNLKADLTLRNINKDESAGCLTVRTHLFAGAPPEPKGSLLSEFGRKKKFIVMIFLYRAKNLPPMNATGDCDPKLLFHFCGAEKQVSSVSTYNPIWNQIIHLEAETEDLMAIDIEKALTCNVYDQEFGKGRDNLIGSFMLRLSKKSLKKYRGNNRKVEFLYQKPQWYPIINDKVDIGDPCFGHVLMGCSVFREEDRKQVKLLTQLGNNNILIKEQNQDKDFQLFLLGVRDLLPSQTELNQKSIFVEMKVGGDVQKVSKKYQIKCNSADINEMISFNVRVPKNKSIIPYIDIKISEDKGAKKQFLGFTSVSLYDVVPSILRAQGHKKNKMLQPDREDQQNNEEDTLLDLDKLQKQLDIVRERKQKQKMLMQKQNEINSQNQKNRKVQDMAVPRELAATTVDTDLNRNNQLDRLIEDFEKEYMTDPKYNYVAQLEKQKDQQDQQKIKRIASLLVQKVEEKNESGYAQDQEQASILSDHQNSSKMLRGMNSRLKKDTKPPSMHNSVLKKKKSSEYQIMDRNSEAERQRVTLNLGENSIKKDFMDLSHRFEHDSERRTLKKAELGDISDQQDSQVMTNFNMNVDEEIRQVEHNERNIKYADLERIIREEEKFTKEAMERQENYKYAAAVKLSLFRWKRGKKADVAKETYLDYDTDPDEALDIIPEWYKNRKILATDFEQLVPNKKILSLPVYQGGNRIANLDVRQKKVIGQLKCIGLAVNESLKVKKQKDYINLLKPRSYVCRIYILKGKSLISTCNKKPSTFLRIKCKGETYDLKKATYCKQDYNPEYYICQQIPMELPGSSSVRIEVIQTTDTFGIHRDSILGYTEIDVQERHFTKKWHLFTEKKPIELRNLYSQYGNGTQGRLQVWMDIIEKKNWLSNPPFQIHPPPFEPFELRVIIWSTKDCVYKNQAFQSNDVYVRGFLGTSQAQETDTHWACRGVGNFNYRLKFEVSYPPKPQDMYSDQFVVQIWDRDVVGYDNLIGEKRINLNRMHRIIEKAVKRNKPVKAKMKIREKALVLTEKFWIDVYNHKVKDQFGMLESQGKVQLSFELVPKQVAQKSQKNGYGRAEPNVFPTLAEPAGRLNFNILHPLDFFKQLCGPDLYNSICTKTICCLVVLVIALLMYFIVGQLIATAIVGRG